MKGGARCAVGALVLSALVTGLLASPATARKTAYAGTYVGPDPLASGVSFKVVSKRKGRGFRPVAVLKFRYSVTVPCTASDGEVRSLRTTPADSVPRMPVSQRQFSNSTTFENLTYEVRGRIPRRGRPTGTIRVSGFYTLPDSGDITCDSTVPWNAGRDPGY